MVENDNYIIEATTSPFEWNEALVLCRAQEVNITLSQRHWEIMYALRELFLAHGRHPATRAFMKALQSQHHASTMLELMQLFGEQPLRTISYIAGLPKPPHCI